MCEALKQLNEEGKADEQITVLALADVDPARNYDNTINTVWYVIDPCSVGMDDADHELDLETQSSAASYRAADPTAEAHRSGIQMLRKPSGFLRRVFGYPVSDPGMRLLQHWGAA